MTPPGPFYEFIRDLWVWIILRAEDAAANYRAAAAARPDKVGEFIKKADVILADGPDAEESAGGRDEALAAWESQHGKYDDPETKAKVAAAAAALLRLERERADRAAARSVAEAAKQADAQRTRRRRGRRD